MHLLPNQYFAKLESNLAVSELIRSIFILRKQVERRFLETKTKPTFSGLNIA